MRDDERQLRMPLEHAAIDHAGDAKRRVERKADPDRQRVVRQVLGESRQHRMLGDRQAELGDARPHRLEAPVVKRHAVEIRSDADADDARRVLDALELDERGLDVRQGKRGEAAHPVGIALRTRDDRIVEALGEIDARLRLEHIDARCVHRQDRDVDALPIHLADQMVGVEHLRAERQPGLAVLEQVAEAIGIGLDRHAGQRAQRIEEDIFDLMGMDVDFHGVVLLSATRWGAIHFLGRWRWSTRKACETTVSSIFSPRLRAPT